MVAPILEVEHGDGGTCSITGGPVYRGAFLPAARPLLLLRLLRGYLRSLVFADGAATELRDWSDQVGVPGQTTGFGVDGAGEMYVTTANQLWAAVAGAEPGDSLGAMSTLFTRIIEGEIPGTFVWRDDECVGFSPSIPCGGAHLGGAEAGDRPLDRLPARAVESPVHRRPSHRRGLQTVFQPTRIGLMIAGLEAHMHIHVVPMDGMHDLDFSNAATFVEREALEGAADAIRKELEVMGLSGASS